MPTTPESSEKPPDEPSRSLTVPISVLVERRLARSGRWVQPQWEVLGVVYGDEVSTEGRGTTLVAEEDGRREYLWSGLRLSLHRDGCESYWYNLLSGRPYLFVVCFLDEDADEEGELTPVLVTASQDEANAHMESDDPVYSVAMPEPLREQLERFVVENYVPERKRKRKRRNWVSESSYLERNRPGATGAGDPDARMPADGSGGPEQSDEPGPTLH